VAAPTWIRADYGLALAALTNLVQNAGKYSTAGGPIVVAASQGGGRVKLSVRDSGPGIGPDDLPHIFEKFYRGKVSKDVKGTGLGLSIVKAMVELSGGTVSVESNRAGTVFTVEMPAAAAPA
jgi:signal transduction histidine kinase